jgi:multidrug efflux pump subunit AcrA (membrane-fusion protein)
MKRLVAALCAACLLLAFTGCSKDETPASGAPDGTPVQVLDVTRGEIAAESRLSGQVTAARSVAVYAPTAAEVIEVLAKNGDAVEQNQVLLRLDSGDVQKQYDSLYDNYTRTKKLLNEQIAAAKQGVEDAKTITNQQVTLAEQNAYNTAELFRIGAASQLEVDSANNAAAQARISAESSVRQAELAVTQAETSAASTLNTLEDNLDTMKDLLDDTAVKAPFAGVVSGLSLTRGSTAAPQIAICTVSEVGSARISLAVSETVQRYLAPGDEVRVTIASLSADAFTATIRSVSPSPSQVTSLYDVSIDLPEALEATNGMFADVTVKTERHDDAVLAPTEAILSDGTESYVFIVNGDNTATRIVVTTGLIGSSLTEITSGLSGGERIVTKGQSYLSDGAAVRVVTGEETA